MLLSIRAVLLAIETLLRAIRAVLEPSHLGPRPLGLELLDVFTASDGLTASGTMADCLAAK
jgi:hypothetical protein